MGQESFKYIPNLLQLYQVVSLFLDALFLIGY